MKIKIITTEKKLSKSLISQMMKAPIEALERGEVLGYVIKVVKDSYKAFIIHWNDDYYIIEGNWEKGVKDLYRRSTKGGSYQKKFKDEKLKDKWWNAYQKVLKHDRHIYI